MKLEIKDRRRFKIFGADFKRRTPLLSHRMKVRPEEIYGDGNRRRNYTGGLVRTNRNYKGQSTTPDITTISSV